MEIIKILLKKKNQNSGTIISKLSISIFYPPDKKISNKIAIVRIGKKSIYIGRVIVEIEG